MKTFQQGNLIQLSALFVVWVLVGSGCHRLDDSLRDAELPVEAAKVSAAKTNLPASGSESLAASPATKDLTPEGVVRGYIQCLQSHQLSDAERFLSRASVANFRRAELSLEPPGSEKANYEILAPRFATNKQELAYVECKISDTIEGEPVNSSLMWMVRREGDTWRITGMSIVMEEGQGPQLLSFENQDDVDFILTHL